MNCQNCGIEIPPTWTAALTANTCPACGQPIMDEQTQTLTKELSEALKVMPNNAEAIAGWLISNYKLTKINSYDPVVSTTATKKPRGNTAQAIGRGQPLSPSDLLKNAGMDVDYDKLVKEAAIARGNFPPSIVKSDFDEVEVAEDDYDNEEGLDEEQISNNELNRIMKKIETEQPQLPTSKALQAEYQKIALKNQLAKQAIEGGAPPKGGFCRA